MSSEAPLPPLPPDQYAPSCATQEQRALAAEWLLYWTEVLKLQAWQISITHVDDTQESDNSASRCLACTTTQLPYLRATIQLHSTLWARASIPAPPPPEMTFLHEMLHIATAQTRYLARKVLVGEKLVTWDAVQEAYETQTDALTKAFWEMDSAGDGTGESDGAP